MAGHYASADVGRAAEAGECDFESRRDAHGVARRECESGPVVPQRSRFTKRFALPVLSSGHVHAALLDGESWQQHGEASGFIPQPCEGNDFARGFVPPRAANPCVYRSFTRVTVVPMQQTRSAAFPITDTAAMGATLRPERKTYKHHRFLHQADQGFNGSLQSLAFNVKVKIVAIDKDNDKGPDYRVLVGALEIGAAWKRQSSASKEYLSVKLDDPSQRP